MIRHWFPQAGLAALVLLCACLPAGPAWAQAAESTPPAFTLQVRAPDDVRTLLLRHLDIRRFQAVPDLDATELQRLARLAEGDARELLGTLGYFAAAVEIRLEPASGERPPSIVVEVDPGTQATVSEVRIDFVGDIATSQDQQLPALREAIRQAWRLPPGQRFTQDGWDEAKTAALRTLGMRRYPAASVGQSLADVDAAAGTARLGLRLDSGPLFRLGALQVSGLQRYDPVLVPRLAQLGPGTVYDRDLIQRAQLRLTGSGYFDAAFIHVDPEGPADPAPVQVTVREAPLKRLVLGVGASTDAGPRLSADYIHNRVPGLGWRAVNRLQLDRRQPFLQSELTGLPDENRWRWVTAARTERLDDGALVTTTQRLRLGRQQNEERFDRHLFVQYDRALVQVNEGVLPPEDSGDGAAVTANWHWSGRDFDRLAAPERGRSLGLELAVGTTLGAQRSPFQRSLVRGLWLLPLPVGRLQLRGEAGAVLSRSEARVPATQLFRTGGDTTVRGYGLRDIGVRQDGVVAPGRYLAVGSLEWQRPIRRDGVLTAFEHTLFVDAGAVADEPSRLRPSWGLGTGVRWRSPLGPVQADLAYGVDPRRLRLHLTLSAAF